jgi:hypothetical protein
LISTNKILKALSNQSAFFCIIVKRNVMSYNTTCLNCNELVTKKFCPNCGQKTDTHRITFKHFITHDLLHGVWHIEKGILFTLKEALLRPGKAALDYISGKRIRYYNVFYLTLLMIGLNLFLTHYYDQLSQHYFGTFDYSSRNKVGTTLDTFLNNYSKILLFSVIPLFALNSFILFRKKKLNLSEHFIIAGMIFLGFLSIVTVGIVISFLYFLNYVDVITDIIDYLIPLLLLFFLIKNYYSTFKNSYSTFNISWRLLLFILLLLIELFAFIILLYGYITDWKFGKVTF